MIIKQDARGIQMKNKDMQLAKGSDEDFHEMVKYFNSKEHKRQRLPNGWRRIIWGFIVLRDHCADKSSDILEFCPYLNGHVANEQ